MAESGLEYLYVFEDACDIEIFNQYRKGQSLSKHDGPRAFMYSLALESLQHEYIVWSTDTDDVVWHDDNKRILRGPVNTCRLIDANCVINPMSDRVSEWYKFVKSKYLGREIYEATYDSLLGRSGQKFIKTKLKCQNAIVNLATLHSDGCFGPDLLEALYGLPDTTLVVSDIVNIKSDNNFILGSVECRAFIKNGAVHSISPFIEFFDTEYTASECDLVPLDLVTTFVEDHKAVLPYYYVVDFMKTDIGWLVSELNNYCSSGRYRDNGSDV